LDDPLDPPTFNACNAIVASVSGGFDKNNQCAFGGPQFRMTAVKSTVEIQYSLTDELAINAVPEALRDMINTSSIRFLGYYFEAEATWQKTEVSGPGDVQNCNTSPADAYCQRHALCPPGLRLLPQITVA
jgi:hypothetical protein